MSLCVMYMCVCVCVCVLCVCVCMCMRMCVCASVTYRFGDLSWMGGTFHDEGRGGGAGLIFREELCLPCSQKGKFCHRYVRPAGAWGECQLLRELMGPTFFGQFYGPDYESDRWSGKWDGLVPKKRQKPPKRRPFHISGRADRTNFLYPSF